MSITFRSAEQADLADLIALLADDALGASREDGSMPINERYLEAFAAISASADNELLLAESDGKLAGMVQLTFIPNLSHLGSRRCLIEGVRVSTDFRGRGIGHKLMREAIRRAGVKQCKMVQLTSNKSRSDALRFYESLGFKATHEGFKLSIG